MTFINSTVLYNDLPSLDEAEIRRQAASVDGIINGPLREVFIKHDAFQTFCLYLQHRHHTIGDDEAVVKVEGTAHVMNSEEMENIESFGNKIAPTTWMSTKDGVLPMEYAVVAANVKTAIPSPAFLNDLSAILALKGCEGLFGLDTLAKNAWAELTVGSASIVIPSDGSDLDHFIPVALAFSKDDPHFIVHGKCGRDHKHTSKPS